MKTTDNKSRQFAQAFQIMDLETFFEEKQVPYTEWEIKKGEISHFIDSDYVIEVLLNTQGDERLVISRKLSSLDFQNASIVDYLKYLAECLVNLYQS